MSYVVLSKILCEAYDQAAEGKGKERHADEGVPFEEQEVFQINRLLRGDPEAAPKYQAMKKIRESGRRPYPEARGELLGAIVQIAVAIILLDERHAEKDNPAEPEKKEE